jgi:hypothetical protein
MVANGLLAEGGEDIGRAQRVPHLGAPRVGVTVRGAVEQTVDEARGPGGATTCLLLWDVPHWFIHARDRPDVVDNARPPPLDVVRAPPLEAARDRRASPLLLEKAHHVAPWLVVIRVERARQFARVALDLREPFDLPNRQDDHAEVLDVRSDPAPELVQRPELWTVVEVEADGQVHRRRGVEGALPH